MNLENKFISKLDHIIESLEDDIKEKIPKLEGQASFKKLFDSCIDLEKNWNDILPVDIQTKIELIKSRYIYWEIPNKFIDLININRDELKEVLENQFRKSCSNLGWYYGVVLLQDGTIESYEIYGNMTHYEWKEKNLIIHEFKGFNCMDNVDEIQQFYDSGDSPENWNDLTYDEKIEFINSNYPNFMSDLEECEIDYYIENKDFDKILQDRIDEIRQQDEYYKYYEKD